MKNISRAFTLVELILAAVIVSIVVAGVFSAEYALRRMNESGAKDVNVNIQVKSIAEAVRGTMRTLHGDLTGACSNHGIYANDSSDNTVCFRHDFGSTPGVYTDDKWTCYTLVGTSMYTCEKDSATPCSNANTFVGQLVGDEFTNAAIPDPTVTCDSTTGEYYFEMTFVGRQEPSANAAVTAGSLTSGTETNPQVVIKIRENAPGF